MVQQKINTRVELDEKTHKAFGTLARTVERRSNRELHRLLIGRVVQLWETSPGELERLGIIRPGQ